MSGKGIKLPIAADLDNGIENSYLAAPGTVLGNATVTNCSGNLTATLATLLDMTSWSRGVYLLTLAPKFGVNANAYWCGVIRRGTAAITITAISSSAITVSSSGLVLQASISGGDTGTEGTLIHLC